MSKRRARQSAAGAPDDGYVVRSTDRATLQFRRYYFETLKDSSASRARVRPLSLEPEPQLALTH